MTQQSKQLFWKFSNAFTKELRDLIIKDLDNEITNNPDLKKQWKSRQISYEQERENLEINDLGPQASGGVGGAKKSIKCLHSHTADELSTGQNVIGKIVIESIGVFNCEEVCVNPETFEKNKDWKIIW